MTKRTLFLSLMVLYPLGPALARDWPQWRGPDRTGVSKEKGLLESWPAGGPKLLWTFRDAGPGHSGMLVVGERLYSMGGKGDKDCVFAIDLKTQKKLWSTEVGDLLVSLWGNGPRSTPTIDDNLLYAIDGGGNLICVETASGRKVWSQRLLESLGGGSAIHGFCYSPLVDGDQVVALTHGEGGMVGAFDKKTGVLKWRSINYTKRDATYGATYSSMIAIEVGGIRQYVHVTVGEGLAGLRASDGKLLWRFVPEPEMFGACNTPIYQNGYLYVSCGYGFGSLLLKLTTDRDEFKVKQIYYNRKEMDNLCYNVILVGNYVYGYSDVNLTCQDFKTGQRVWRRENPRKLSKKMGMGTITFADGNLYCYHENRGDVLLIKATPAGYKEQGKFRIPEESKLRRKNKDAGIYTHPVVANGKLYLRDQELIFCYDIHKSLP